MTEPLARQASRVAAIGRKVWSTLEAIGQQRARRELDWLALRHAHNAELAQALRSAIPRSVRR